MTSIPSLTLESLRIRLGERELSLDAPAQLEVGNIVVVTGPSGSGKSSFARALLGLGDLVSPRIQTKGDVSLTDATGVEHPLLNRDTYFPRTREHIAFLPQADRLGFVSDLSTLENVRLFSDLSASDARVRAEKIGAQFHLMSLPDIARASGGEKMRLSAIRSLLPRKANGETPALVIADEPTTGLDPQAAESLANELKALAADSDSLVVVITHNPDLFIDDEQTPDSRDVLIIQAGKIVGRLKMTQGRPTTWIQRRRPMFAEWLSMIGAFVLSPLALLAGLVGIKRPVSSLRVVLRDALSPTTHLFSWIGCVLVSGTVAFFIFEQLPRPEIVEPLLLGEILQATGHTLIRVVLPLAAATFVAIKLGASQAARLASGVRNGLLDTLALARYPVEGFALVPNVLSQIVAMSLATVVACYSGLLVACLVYVGGHDGASMGLAFTLMTESLDAAGPWREFLIAKTLVSGFIAGALATLFGIAPATSDQDVAKSVHRTLLWGVLAVIAFQCAMIIWEFATQ